MAAVSAWDLGYFSAGECLTQLDRTVDTLQKLPRYRGHFFNWYDTQSLVPLAPLYVSTVDSGNLLGYLMTISGALPSIADAELSIDRRFQDGLSDTLDLFERDARPVVASLGRESARDFRADLRRIRAALDATPVGIAGTQRVASVCFVGNQRARRAPARCAAPAAARRREGRQRQLVARQRGRDDHGNGAAILPTFQRSADEVRLAMQRTARASSRRHRAVHRQHRARLPLRSRTAPVRDRLQRHRRPARSRPTTTHWPPKRVSRASSPSRCATCRRSTGSSWAG